MKNTTFENSFQQLRAYCEQERFKGWDPYDGLNSKLFQASPLKYFAITREIWIQFYKRCPINFRSVGLVPKEHNPKGLGLFLTAYCNLFDGHLNEETEETIRFLADRLDELKSPGYSGACWGYNFQWQSLVFFQEKYAPTVVATTFVAYALMDAYDCLGDQRFLDLAISSAEFVMKDLHQTKKPMGLIFSYSPKDQTCIYNASLLASRLLSRSYSYTGDKPAIELAQQSVAACVDAQHENGAWYQGEEINQKWTDSFHTGYNLEAIAEYSRFSGDDSFLENLERGWQYLVDNFFLEDGTPKYYDNKTFPIDIHAPAQFIVTAHRLGKLEEQRALVDRVVDWTIQNMQDPSGYFYYQKRRSGIVKIPYMRWTQAWMFYGMSFYRRHALWHEQNAPTDFEASIEATRSQL